MSTPVSVPDWALADLGLDVSIGDHVAWPVAPLDHAWSDQWWVGYASVDLRYEHDPDEVTGTVSGTVVSIQALASRYDAAEDAGGNSTTAWPARSTATAGERGRPLPDEFIFEIEPDSQMLPER
jgi:hypothetical protein